MARAVLLIRWAMGVPSNWKRNIVGGFIAAVFVWLGACDLNPQPLPPALRGGNGSGSTSGGSGNGSDASAGGPGTFSSSGSSGDSSGSSSGAPLSAADGGAPGPVGGDAAAADSGVGVDAGTAPSDAGLDVGPEADAMGDVGNTGDASLEAPGD